MLRFAEVLSGQSYVHHSDLPCLDSRAFHRWQHRPHRVVDAGHNAAFYELRHGEIYGIASTPDRFLMRELGARTPIRVLYLAGQDAARLGVVGALYGGVIGASAAAGKNFFTVVLKPRAARSLHGPRGIGAVAQRTIRA